jgi:hypothetical protein
MQTQTGFLAALASGAAGQKRQNLVEFQFQ